MTFDRTTQDVGNIIALEHVNLRVPDFHVATTFYVHGLGCTRDPYIDLGPNLVWFNIGDQQFHVPLAEAPDVLRGVINVVVPRLDDLEQRLENVTPALGGTAFDYSRDGDLCRVTGPYGNQFSCREADDTTHRTLALESVQFLVPEGSAESIAAFYRSILGAPSTTEEGLCRVDAGPRQHLVFRETDAPLPDYDGHHIAIYVADFSSPYGRLVERELLFEESNDAQYRFLWIVDPGSGEPVFEIEHEVRSMYHPLYRRALVNRNLRQASSGCVPGADPFSPVL